MLTGLRSPVNKKASLGAGLRVWVITVMSTERLARHAFDLVGRGATLDRYSSYPQSDGTGSRFYSGHCFKIAVTLFDRVSEV
jgi:hypothetical protein